ncbi:MAG: bifunctional phosphopantothenoylcysteine decarboxylase/phosphopantothenate--cysteine ligase CoaBC [Bacteroidia bacterium]|nr:bifunctional phosphopantothenoylcysteine decarboxylase/phosphopantothenate--cysteine ligase CoaBC [Bacteroidia bacterium]
MLSGKKIVLGITGSIAAYKTASLLRMLIKHGAEVQVVMTDAAKEFVTPLTLATLSKKPVYTSFVLNTHGQWANHVELALWADCILIAPASANTIAKMAYGLCDNLLTAIYLSAKSQVFVAPAMDLDMYAHPTTKRNLTTLKSFGNVVLPVGNGELASGLSGEGRMLEETEIVNHLVQYFDKTKRLAKKKVLVTAGPTYENIDPVRFIGNHSSGKMGFALAEEFANEGAEVTLITGPTQLICKHTTIKRIDVTSAEDMYNAVTAINKKQDILVMSAAVADYKPSKVSKVKIKKNNSNFDLPLTKTKDILAYLGKVKPKNQILVGFALETNNELEHAIEKLKKKNLNFIVLNSLRNKGAGFATDTNQITILDKHNQLTEFPLKSKTEVAKDIINTITTLL